MTHPPRPTRPSFWTTVAVRVVAIFVAGVALVVFFHEVIEPILKEDVERVQQKHAPSGERTGSPDGHTRGARE